MSKLPTPASGPTKTCFNAIADALLPLLRQQKALEAQIDSLKTQARDIARAERTSPDISSVEIIGQPNVRVLVTFVANKTKFKDGVSYVDMKRLQGLAGADVVVVDCDVALNDRVSASQVKNEIGDELFNKLFKVINKEKFNGVEFDSWVNKLAKLRTANDDSSSQALALVSKITVSKEETPRVTGS